MVIAEADSAMKKVSMAMTVTGIDGKRRFEKRLLKSDATYLAK